MLNNLPETWHMEADLVALGSGLGGLAAAITAHDHGLSAIVLEKADQVGGVTALSLGEMWVPGNRHGAAMGVDDSADSGFRYLKRLAMNYNEDLATLNFTVHAREALAWFEDNIGLRVSAIRNCPDYYYGHNNDAVAEGRMLEVLPFPAETLGDWQSRTRVSPFTPYGMTHPDMMERGGSANMLKWDYALMGDRLAKDERCLGPGLAAFFVKGALDRGIAMHTGVSAEGLIGDGTRIVGLRARRGDEDLFIKANRGVVVAVSSYERDRKLTRTLSQQLDIHSMIFPQVDGANFRLTGPAGARIAKVPDVTLTGVLVPGEEQEDGSPVARSGMSVIGLPHTIVVNRKAERFGNEAFYRDFYQKIDLIDGNDQTHPNFPCWVILDSQARAKYPFASIMPGQDLPDGMGVKADTIGELAARLGLDPAALTRTVADFNQHAEQGKDPVYGRGSHPWSVVMCGDPFHKPNANLGPVSQGPFYGVEMVRMGGSAIPATGVVANEHMQAVDWDGLPIPGLYVAGNSVARLETGATMQSGISNARGMAHGWLAALHAAGKPSQLLAPEAARLGL